MLVSQNDTYVNRYAAVGNAILYSRYVHAE